MDRNILRIVKIEKEALMEFIYENFVAQQEAILEVSPLGVMRAPLFLRRIKGKMKMVI